MSRTNYTGVSKDDVTGKYLYYFKSGVDRATGKPYQERKRGFETAKEAHEARIHAMKKVHDMGGVFNTQMLFETFVNTIFLPEYYARVTNPEKVKERRQAAFNELIGVFGKKKPRNITIFEVQRYKQEVIGKHSKSYAKQKFSLLSQILKSARDYGMLRDVLTEKVGNVVVDKKTIDFWTREEFEQVISSLDRADYYEHFVFMMIWLYYMTGMRVNEATGLYWSDIDFDSQKIKVFHQLDYYNVNKWERLSKLKTESSRRIISIDDDTCEILKSWYERQQTFDTNIDFVISFSGNPVDKRAIREILAKYAKRAKVTVIQPKALRHSHASFLINELNVTPLLIQKRLGHSDIKTTLGIYSHLYPNADESIMSELKGRIKYE